MGTTGRPTLRMLREDLTSDWDRVEDKRAVDSGDLARVPPVPGLGHPLVQYFTRLSRDGDVTQENISGLKDPPWWKVKSGRWRGAAWEDPHTRQVWLCAAGLRREGERDDFYRRFMHRANTAGASLLPTDEDRRLLRREQLDATMQSWASQVSVLTVTALRSAVGSPGVAQAFTVPTLNGHDPLIEVDIEVDDADSCYEIFVTTRVADWSQQRLAGQAELIMLCAICPIEQRWDTSPTRQGQRYSVITDRRGLLHMLSDAEQFRGVRRPSIPGPQSHYTPKGDLTRRTIEGSAVQALCGVWFVPRQDHLDREVCGECTLVYQAYPEG